MKNIRVNLLGLVLMSFFAVNLYPEINQGLLKQAKRGAIRGNLSFITELTKDENLDSELASELLKITIWSMENNNEIFEAAQELIQRGAKYELTNWELDWLYDRRFIDMPKIVDLLVKNMSLKAKARCKSWRFLGYISGDNKETQAFTREFRKKKVAGKTPLMDAANRADYPEVKRLVESGDYLKVKDSEGRGVLYYCAKSSEGPKDALKCCKYLIKHGAKEDFECYYLDLLYKYEVFAEIRDILYKNMSLFAKIRYTLWNFLASEKNKKQA